MNLEERVYSVLVASAVENFNAALTAMLPESSFHPVAIVSSISAAKRAFAERDYDFVIINSPLPDEPGVNFAIDTSSSKSTITLLFVKSESYIGVYDKLVPHGVFVLSKPLSRQTITLALGWLKSARERLRKIEKKTLSIEEKMGEIRLVNRAKWLLINELKMDEPTAHHYIEKLAMDMCITKRQAAENIISTYS